MQIGWMRGGRPGYHKMTFTQHNRTPLWIKLKSSYRLVPLANKDIQHLIIISSADCMELISFSRMENSRDLAFSPTVCFLYLVGWMEEQLKKMNPPHKPQYPFVWSSLKRLLTALLEFFIKPLTTYNLKNQRMVMLEKIRSKSFIL